MKRLILLLLLLFPATAYSQYTKLSGFCEDGNQTVSTAGITSTTVVQGSFPLCTVTIHDTSTGSLSTIYSDATGTARSNPFTAAADGQWFFYGVPTGRYDVQFSGSTIASPFTIADLSPPPGTDLALINAQNYSGIGTWEKIVSARLSPACATGCAITDGNPNTHSETIDPSFTGLAIQNVPISVLLHGRYTYTGPAIPGGLAHILGSSGSTSGANGSIISCDTSVSSNLTFALPNNTLPCGITYIPSSGSGPVINLDASSGELSSVKVSNISFVVNSNVTDPIQLNDVGNGMADIQIEGNTVINSDSTHSWTGYAVALRCNNASTAANAQYSIDIYRMGIYGNGSAINGGSGHYTNSTSGGILLDPTAGTVCGFLGPSHIDKVWAEGLTGSHFLLAKSAIGLTLGPNCVINSNNFAPNAEVVHVENGALASGIVIQNCQMQDNDWDNNGGVVDVAFPAGAGLTILGGEYSGGDAGPTHAESIAFKIGASTANTFIQGPTIINLATAGTTVTAGALNVTYCASFSAGNGSSNEFTNGLANVPAGSCAHFSAGSSNVMRLVNQSFGNARYWDLNAKVDGTFALQSSGADVLSATPLTVVVNDGPILSRDGPVGAAGLAVTTTTANSTSTVSVVPSGSATSSDLRIFNKSDQFNAGWLDMSINGTTVVFGGNSDGTGNAPTLLEVGPNFKFDGTIQTGSTLAITKSVTISGCTLSFTNGLLTATSGC